VAVKLTVAFVFPTPPSTYGLQLTLRSSSTTHWIVPEARCELPGANAGLTLPVVVPGSTWANATEAEKATSSIDNTNTPMISTFLISSPSWEATSS
jgi:hypothetical protein